MSQKPRVLIVDDDRRMTHTLADILALSGYEPVEACSGAEALERVTQSPFDCVLTDIKMPGMNGVELCQELCKLQPGLPVVLMTAYAAEELIRQGKESGAVGVLDKPLDISQLLAFLALLGKERFVAIVDDDPAFCRTLGDILERRGFRVTQVTDAHAAMDHITAEVQVVLLDMRLNSINGRDMLEQIRTRYPGLPVVLVTGYRQEMAAAIQSALDMKAYTCLYKPLAIPELLQKLDEIRATRLKNVLKAA